MKIGNRQRFPIGNRQQRRQPLPIVLESHTYAIGNVISKKWLPIACKSVNLKESAIGNSAYKENTLADWVFLIFMATMKQRGALALVALAGRDAFDTN